jgi:hypothetical protein
MSQKKTWTEKLADAKAKTPKPHKFYCEEAKQSLVIPTVQEVEDHMCGVKRGRLTTMGQMTELFRVRHKADMCCPMTSGIFAWIVAHAADEQERAGAKRVVPWWRTLKTGGELNPKYPGNGELQRERLEVEGHQVIQKGKKLIVPDYERALSAGSGEVGRPLVRTARIKKPKGMLRKVLSRADFGLCVLLPKTEWEKLPKRGSAQVGVNGEKQRVVVQVERCNCQGDGWHQHRFLSFNAKSGIEEGERVKISL